MTTEEVLTYLDELRDCKDFSTLKEIRNHIRTLIAARNKDWFED